MANYRITVGGVRIVVPSDVGAVEMELKFCDNDYKGLQGDEVAELVAYLCEDAAAGIRKELAAAAK